MKIGTLTMHHSQNYGGLLQTYALQKVLQDLGHDAEVIDYRYPAAEDAMRICPHLVFDSGLRRFIGSVFRFFPNLYQLSSQRIARSLDFISKYIPLSPETYRSLVQISKISEHYDAYIVGSDQVWHPLIMTQCSPFRLEFVNNCKRKIAYAPSLAVSPATVTEEQRNLYRQMLEKFDSVSVREEDAVAFISDCTDKEVQQVLDPALLLGGQDWLDLARTEVRDDGYILCYFIGNYSRAIPFLKQRSKIMGLPVVKVGKDSSDLYSGCRMKIISDAGPLEFLRLLAGSSWFVTNSFHGVALATLIKKKYTVIANTTQSRKAMGSRIHSLLNALKMEAMLYDPDGEFIMPRFDFDSAHSILSELRENSISYLVRALR